MRERIIIDITRVRAEMEAADPGETVPRPPGRGEGRLQTIDIRISGKVQRVGMRNCIRSIAGKLNIRGEVMNLPDGTVRALATGDPILLEKFVSMIYGCPRAVIREISVTDHRLLHFDGFLVKRPDAD
jgi:acylphosphatase